MLLAARRWCLALVVLVAPAASNLASKGFALGVKATQKPIGDLSASLEKGEVVGDLGKKCDGIVASALKAFDGCKAEDEAERAALERFVDGRLELLFRKQVVLLREAAIAELASAKASSDAFGTRTRVDADFEAKCLASKRATADWDFGFEAEALRCVADELAEVKKRFADLQLAAAGTQAHYLSIYQDLTSQIQQLQQAQYKQGPPMNMGFAYRVKDTDINVSGGYQQGRGQFQVAAVDDETRMEGDPAVITAPSHGNLGFSVNL